MLLQLVAGELSCPTGLHSERPLGNLCLVSPGLHPTCLSHFVNFALHSYAMRNYSCAFDCILGPMGPPSQLLNLGVALGSPSTGMNKSNLSPSWIWALLQLQSWFSLSSDVLRKGSGLSFQQGWACECSETPEFTLFHSTDAGFLSHVGSLSALQAGCQLFEFLARSCFSPALSSLGRLSPLSAQPSLGRAFVLGEGFLVAEDFLFPRLL